MKETNVDSMKYRKSTHLAGVDVEMMVKGSDKCILTIKEAYYSHNEIVNGVKTGVNVSGKLLEGYFIEFEEDVKPMMVNSTNRKAINKLVESAKGLSSVESRVLTNWVGVHIELMFDPNVTMKGVTVGGIKVSPLPPKKVKVDNASKPILKKGTKEYDKVVSFLKDQSSVLFEEAFKGPNGKYKISATLKAQLEIEHKGESNDGN